MSLAEYFENAKGLGVLATADNSGAVDVAIYARPHFIDEENIAFIMNHKLSYENISQNPQAAYLFIEETAGYKGKRLYLTKTKESSDPELIQSTRRHNGCHSCNSDNENKHLVYFHIDKIRELV